VDSWLVAMVAAAAAAAEEVAVAVAEAYSSSSLVALLFLVVFAPSVMTFLTMIALAILDVRDLVLDPSSACGSICSSPPVQTPLDLYHDSATSNSALFLRMELPCELSHKSCTYGVL
jgi:hypothetical protein